MKSLASYLFTIFAVMFWMFRVVVALMATLKVDFGIEPINLTYEIVVLFITLITLVMVIKRNIIGALIYFATYLLYFGAYAITGIIDIANGVAASSQYLNIFIAVIAILIATYLLIDILLNKNRTNTSVNKKMDWFYQKRCS